MERCPSMNFTAGNRQADHASCNSKRSGYNDKSRYSMDDFPIGMAYVPWQKWRDIYEPRKAFQTGTIFAELDKPFLGMRGVRK